MSMLPSSRRPSVATETLSPEERELRLKQWLQRKELLDKGLELFVTLDPSRADTDKSLTEAATCAYAIDKMVGNGLPDTSAKPSSSQSVKGDSKKATKTMLAAWTRWAREHHTFNNIRFTAEQAAKFSATVREFLDQDGEDFVLMSLKYSFPAKPKPKEKPRPLSNDQLLQNDVFNKECKRIWRVAKTIVESGGDAVAEESSAKEGAGRKQAPRGEQPSSLFSFGLPQLRRWLEEDEDKMQERAKELAQERAMDKKVAYEGFVKNKDSLRIHLPPAEVLEQGRAKRPQSAPRMNFGRALNTVRAKAAPPPMTTAELMAGSGLKYAHATKRGNQGLQGDLELSRKKLLELGFVSKSNLDVDPEEGISVNAAYRQARSENETLREYKKQHEKTQNQSGKAFDQWFVLKGLRDQALKYLTSVSPPSLQREDRDEDMRMGAVAESKSSGQRAVVFQGSEVDVCIQVGKALKRVDRGLLSEWLRWSANVIPSYNATVLWDAFYPTACDVHSVLGSQVRETFLRILKPGLDFKAAYKLFVDRKIRRKEASENRDYSKEERDEFIRETKLGKKDMTQLLLELGVSMKPHEINALIDAFDSNGDGVVTMQEFLEFTGPTRTTNAGALANLNQRCCWRTTCKETGMGNAFTVCAPVKRSGLDSECKDPDGPSLRGSRSEIKELESGDKRLKVEGVERAKRLIILRRYGEVAGDKKPRRKQRRDRDRKDVDGGRKGYASSEGEDNYETDDFNEEGDEYGDDFENDKGGGEYCQFRSLTESDRREGLKFLEGYTRDARQEHALQDLLTNGSPPTAPQLWAVNHKDPDAVDDGLDFSTELLIQWKPKSGELVSFFSLECSGPAGSGKGDHLYKEVYRDPPDANPDSDFTFCYRMSGLVPGTTYLFRMRGMNGYGPGDFVYKTFTTYPGAPLQPRVIKVTSSACSLRWVLSAFFMKRVGDLKKLFAAVDRDSSGSVSRIELSAALERKANRLPDLEAFLTALRDKLGIDEEAGYAALFDRIEGNDDEEISWTEFENFFVGAGWCEPQPVEGGTAAADEAISVQVRSQASLGVSSRPASAGTARVGDSLRNSRTSLKSDSGQGGKHAFTIASKLTYIVEECQSEFDNVFKEILRTTAGEGTVNHLEPGKSYRFRVYSRNADGGESPRSETVIVHAMLETPQHPTVVQRWPTASIAATSIALQWRDRRHGVTSRDKGVIKRMIGDWTGAGEESGGVSVEVAFGKYDKNGDGMMDISEFGKLLADLGVDCSKERIDFAFNIFDSNHDGTLSFTEFSAFWRRDEVTYTLKRSEPIPFLPVRNMAVQDGVGAKRIGSGLSKTLNSTHNKSAALSKTGPGKQVTSIAPASNTSRPYKEVPTPVTSYRAGNSKIFEERGLIPNQLYHFKLRYVGSRVNSQLSAPLVVMSAPLSPTAAPAVIRYSGTSVKLKWYPPQYGAFKFEVQLLTVSSPTGSKTTEWVSAYSGQENTFMTTTLAPDSVYQARVLCINYQGTPSEPSEIVTFKTLPRSENSLNLTTKNVSSSFTIECVADICVGDIILMTERLFAKAGASPDIDIGQSLGPQSSVRLDKGVRMDMSVTTVTGEEPTPGAFIGERTIACHVVRDNYRTYRESMGSNAVDPIRFSRSRRLWLEVIWEQASTNACRQYKLSPGTIIERTQRHFEQFEVFRTVWTKEEARMPFASEIASLSECFLIPDI